VQGPARLGGGPVGLVRAVHPLAGNCAGAFAYDVDGYCGRRMEDSLEPAFPPAPEVVDVPQPAPLPKTVAHFYIIRALPEPHRVSWNMPGDGPQWVRVNDALWLHVDDLRAMLADIDAQKGGAS